MTPSGVDTVRMYRWDGANWRPDGVVPIPELPGIGRGGGLLQPVKLTGSGAPDFTLVGYGADTRWFSVVSRIGGRWHAVPFAYGGGTVAIDAYGVRAGLVRAEANACGCAVGPETYSWFRFESTRFVPTSPPGPAPVCNGASLNGAERLEGPYQATDPLLGHLASAFIVIRFACQDGWALADGSQAGKPGLALYQQQGRGWLKVAVGSTTALGRYGDEFALPRSVLLTLAAKIDQVLAPAPRFTQYMPSALPVPKSPASDRTPAEIEVRPGMSYTDSWSSYTAANQNWFVALLESSRRRAGREVTLDADVFRWQRSAWVPEGNVHLELTSSHPESGVEFVSTASLTGATDYVVDASRDPSRKVVISNVGGKWHVILFQTGGRTTAAIDGNGSSNPHVILSDTRTRRLVYRFRNDRLEIVRDQPLPGCGVAALSKRLLGRVRFTRSACAYGWALALGIQKHKPVAVLFSFYNNRWMVYDSTAPANIYSRFGSGGAIAPWLLAALTQGVRH